MTFNSRGVKEYNITGADRKMLCKAFLYTRIACIATPKGGGFLWRRYVLIPDMRAGIPIRVRLTP
ncbi:hypothetical protein KL86SPO_20237 [uncultured Sporomusa sp.]|uniref:Uncharacterized protein n=1 Tax=uncultured Sporomusa sp. TaxID=307249 RepID=A0A212LMM5_9FIRM|nr:hypothetical protein KL86SPO_20237 [uncultured Sporomusa sp.]